MLFTIDLFIVEYFDYLIATNINIKKINFFHKHFGDFLCSNTVLSSNYYYFSLSSALKVIDVFSLYFGPTRCRRNVKHLTQAKTGIIFWTKFYEKKKKD